MLDRALPRPSFQGWRRMERIKYLIYFILSTILVARAPRNTPSEIGESWHRISKLVNKTCANAVVDDDGSTGVRPVGNGHR
jgi:hypothetical protein